MNKIGIIEHSRNLEEKKEELKRALKAVEKETEQTQSDCEHISVIMKDINICLLCGKTMQSPTKLAINASNYLSKISEMERKFDNIRTLSIGIMRDNPDMTNEQLVDQFNELMDHAIKKQEDSKETGSQLVKK